MIYGLPLPDKALCAPEDVTDSWSGAVAPAAPGTVAMIDGDRIREANDTGDERIDWALGYAFSALTEELLSEHGLRFGAIFDGFVSIVPV
jgi:hypothetical protein